MDTPKFNQKQKQELAQLAELIGLIYLALKNIQIYPAGHSLVKNRLTVAHQLLTKILLNRKTLLFGIARNIITFDGQPLGQESQVCSALAKILSRHEVASLNFSYGMSQHSLFTFLKAVGVLPEQKQSGRSLQQELSSLNLPHIDVEIINYNYFDRTKSTDPEKDDPNTLTWLSFTQNLTSGILGYSGNSKATDPESKMATPEALAAAINRHANKQPEIIQQFSTLLNQMLRHSPQETRAPSSFGGKELSRIIASLNPDLREQFLNTTLERCDQNMQHTNPEKILETFSDSVVLDMIGQINKKNVSVSPVFFNLIRKLSKIRFTTDSATPAAVARQREINNLLDPESYNKHVGPNYHKSLQQLANPPSPPDSPPSDFPLDEHLATLEEDHLNRQILRATLLFMGQSDREKEYAELAEKLMEICLVLPDTGAFDLLQITIKTLKKQAAQKKSAAIRTIAGQCIEELTALDFIDYIYSILPEASDKERADAIDLLKLLCPDIIDKLLKIFCMKPKVSEDDPLVTIFMTFRLETLTRAFTLLPKTTTINIRKLLVLVEYLGLQGTVRLLHPFLYNEDLDIRMQVLGLLLPMNDEEAIATLISMLESKNEHTVETAIDLCSTHIPPACVPSLLKLLEYQFVKQTAIERNRKLFLVLSHLGDSKALPCLEKIAFSKWPFHREQILTMKRILFYSLKGYQNEDRIKLVKKGLQLKDDEIHKICNALLPSRQTKLK